MFINCLSLYFEKRKYFIGIEHATYFIYFIKNKFCYKKQFYSIVYTHTYKRESWVVIAACLTDWLEIRNLIMNKRSIDNYATNKRKGRL